MKAVERLPEFHAIYEYTSGFHCDDQLNEFLRIEFHTCDRSSKVEDAVLFVVVTYRKNLTSVVIASRCQIVLGEVY